MSCEDLTTQLFAFVRFHDHQDFVLAEMFEGEILVSIPFDVTDIGTDQSTEDRAPGRSDERDSENPPDGQTRDQSKGERESTQKTDRRSDDRPRSRIERQLAIGISLEHDMFTGSKSNAQTFAPEPCCFEVSDHRFGNMTVGKDRSNMVISWHGTTSDFQPIDSESTSGTTFLTDR